HQLEELPGIRRQALDIAPLPLGVDRVKGERRLARPREPGDHHQAVARQVDIDVLEVMLPRAADPDLLLHASNLIAGPRPAPPPDSPVPQLREENRAGPG